MSEKAKSLINADSIIFDDPEQVALTEAQEKRRLLEERLKKQKNIWGYSSLGLEAKSAAVSVCSMSHGLYGRIPLICRGEKCPYAESCALVRNGLAPPGEYCPMETTMIEQRVVEYTQDFDLNNASFTDRNLVSEIINLDIIIERCKALMANEQTLIVDVVTGVTEDGESYTHPEVSKAFEIYERAQKRRNELYNLMMATRRDQKVPASTNTITTILEKVKYIESEGGFVEPEYPEVQVNESEDIKNKKE